MLFICYPKCSTCQKARKPWLEERGSPLKPGTSRPTIPPRMS